MSNCSVFPAQDVCPDKYQNCAAFLARMPRGRAWGNHDGGPFPGSTLYNFWLSVGDFYTYINDRICFALSEFFCSSAIETADWWFEEYGLPDGCDPFPNPCDKILWYAPPVCANWVASAARAGWAITNCVWLNTGSGAQAGCAQAGCAQSGDLTGNCFLQITVSLSQSPAFTGALTPPAQAGAQLAGTRLACAPDLTGLECLMSRIGPAHATILYEVVA